MVNGILQEQTPAENTVWICNCCVTLEITLAKRLALLIHNVFLTVGENQATPFSQFDDLCLCDLKVSLCDVGCCCDKVSLSTFKKPD